MYVDHRKCEFLIIYDGRRKKPSIKVEMINLIVIYCGLACQNPEVFIHNYELGVTVNFQKIFRHECSKIGVFCQPSTTYHWDNKSNDVLSQFIYKFKTIELIQKKFTWNCSRLFPAQSIEFTWFIVYAIKIIEFKIAYTLFICYTKFLLVHTKSHKIKAQFKILILYR